MDLPALPEVVSVTRECDVCGDELPSSDLVEVGDGRVCPECHGALFVDGSTDTAGTKSTDDRSRGLQAFADAVEFFHEQLDRPIDDHPVGEHVDRPDTGREYFEHVRGWNAGDLRSLAADRGYDAKAFRDELRENGIRPLIKHRL